VHLCAEWRSSFRHPFHWWSLMNVSRSVLILGLYPGVWEVSEIQEYSCFDQKCQESAVLDNPGLGLIIRGFGFILGWLLTFLRNTVIHRFEQTLGPGRLIPHFLTGIQQCLGWWKGWFWAETAGLGGPVKGFKTVLGTLRNPSGNGNYTLLIRNVEDVQNDEDPRV